MREEVYEHGKNWAHATLPLYGVGNGYMDTTNERFPLLEHLMLPSEPASMYLLEQNWFSGGFLTPSCSRQKLWQ